MINALINLDRMSKKIDIPPPQMHCQTINQRLDCGAPVQTMGFVAFLLGVRIKHDHSVEIAIAYVSNDWCEQERGVEFLLAKI